MSYDQERKSADQPRDDHGRWASGGATAALFKKGDGMNGPAEIKEAAHAFVKNMGEADIAKYHASFGRSSDGPSGFSAKVLNSFDKHLAAHGVPDAVRDRAADYLMDYLDSKYKK